MSQANQQQDSDLEDFGDPNATVELGQDVWAEMDAGFSALQLQTGRWARLTAEDSSASGGGGVRSSTSMQAVASGGGGGWAACSSAGMAATQQQQPTATASVQLNRREQHDWETRQGPAAADLSLLPLPAAPWALPPFQQQQHQPPLQPQPQQQPRPTAITPEAGEQQELVNQPGECRAAPAAAPAAVGESPGFTLLHEDALSGTCSVAIPSSSASGSLQLFLAVNFPSLLGAAKAKVCGCTAGRLHVERSSSSSSSHVEPTCSCVPPIPLLHPLS